MSHTMVHDSVNIDIKPVVNRVNTQTQITIGDLHGNAVKLLYSLVRHGIVDISEEQYRRFVAIYRTDTDDLTDELIQEFNYILSTMSIIDRNKLIRLIGDEVGDRGQNDYFTLKLLQKLHQEQVPVTTLLSNHGHELIIATELFPTFRPFLLPWNFTKSLHNMQSLIDKGLITKQEVVALYHTVYKTKLKLIDYSLSSDKGEITLFSHAPIGLDAIRLVAKRLSIQYEDSTPLALANTVDAINKAFEVYVNNNTINTLIYPEGKNLVMSDSKLTETNAIEFIMQNRDCSDLERPATLANGGRVNYVHGHDMNAPRTDNIFNLDNMLARSLSEHRGDYDVLVSDDPILHTELIIDKTIDESNFSGKSPVQSTLAANSIFSKVQTDEFLNDLDFSSLII